MRIKLDCGTEVLITDCRFGMTYSGLLEGAPDDSLNDQLIHEAKTTQAFGEGRPTRLIPPVIDRSSRYPCLPPYVFTAWLTDRFSETHLVLVWFRDGFEDLSFSQIILEAAKALPWHDLADEYIF